MRPGDVTYAHAHDDNDELLAGVYFIDVPAQSGKLVLKPGTGTEDVVIEPRAGLFVFFSPVLLHEVTGNESPQPRLSAGFNVGSARA